MADARDLTAALKRGVDASSRAGGDDVDSPSTAYEVMETKWRPLRALRSGTQGMRAEREEYLPQEARESDDLYDARLNRSVLYPFYDSTVKNLASKPFQRAVVLKEETPDLVESWEADIDLQGTSMTDFARAGLDSAIDRGMVHALTDVPMQPGSQRRRVRTLAEERASGLRPYAKLIRADNVIAWRTERINGGPEVLTHLRIFEALTVPNGEFGEKQVEQIRVYDRELPRPPSRRGARAYPGETTWRLFERDSSTARKNDWILLDGGVISINRIPLHTLYLEKKKTLVATPALMELGMLNVAHWQSWSDLRNLAHTTSLPVLWGSGWDQADLTDADGNKALVFGPNQVWLAANENATLGFIEHTGAALGFHRQLLTDLETRMVELALRPFLESVPRRTATEAAITAGNMVSEMLAWIRLVEGWLTAINDEMLVWMGETPGTSLDVFSDFSVLAQQAQELKDARANGDISLETYWSELVRRGILAESFDPKREKIRVTAEKKEADEREMEKLKAAQPPEPEENDEDDDDDESSSDDE